MILKKMLQRSDPFRKKQCRSIDCLVCRTGGKGYRCSTGVTYELIFQIRRHKYIRETSRSAYTCSKEHQSVLDQREESSVMWRHWCDKHGGDVPESVMNVTETFHNDVMLWQITEMAMIDKVPELT